MMEPTAASETLISLSPVMLNAFIGCLAWYWLSCLVMRKTDAVWEKTVSHGGTEMQLAKWRGGKPSDRLFLHGLGAVVPLLVAVLLLWAHV